MKWRTFGPCLVVSVILPMALSGCVKKATYNNTGKPVVQNQVNMDEAARTRIALGLQYLKIGEMSSAKFNLEKALGFAPKLPAVHTAFAYYYQKVGEMELAEKSYLKALDMAPNDPDTLNNYGAFLCQLKRYDQAEATFLKAIDVPSYLQVAQSYENAALCAMENREYAKAKTYFAQSLDHSALRANTLINVAALSYAMGDYQDAQKYTQRLGNIGVISPRMLLLRSLTELKLGNLAQSKKHGTTLLSMYVKTPEALMYLSKNFDDSEFEQLRRLYLQHQVDKLKAQRKEAGEAMQAKAKVRRKLTPPVDENNPAPLGTVTSSPSASVVTTQTNQAKPADVAQPAANRGYSLINRPAETAEPDETAKAAKQPEGLAQATPERSSTPEVTEPTVAAGQTANTQTVQHTPSVDAGDSISEAEEAPFHVVAYGETLFEISVKYNIKLRRLLQWNNMTERSRLKVGRKIYLDHPTHYHVIGKGDTLFGISLKYNILMANLLRWNDLEQDSPLLPGQKILIAEPGLAGHQANRPD